MESIDVKCAACGKTTPVAVPKDAKGPQTAVLKCACGATTEMRSSDGRPGEMLKVLNELASKLPALIKQIRESRNRGVDTGLGEAIADASREFALEVLQEDRDVRDALKGLVRRNLRRNFLSEGHEGVE